MVNLTLPSLSDVHTHLRVPGGEHKEDFATGTAVALAGRSVTILAMPNTMPPSVTPEVLQATRQKAQHAIYYDVGLFAGMTLTGRIERVLLPGQPVYDASQPGLKDKVVAQSGSGQVLP